MINTQFGFSSTAAEVAAGEKTVRDVGGAMPGAIFTKLSAQIGIEERPET